MVEINRDDARSLGVIWGAAWTPRTGQDGPIVDLRGAASPRVGSDQTGVPPTSTAANFPAAAPAITGFAANPFALALGYLASNFALDIQIQALEGEGRARVISRPSVTTARTRPPSR